jgi:hypothetical protein
MGDIPTEDVATTTDTKNKITEYNVQQNTHSMNTDRGGGGIK